MRPRTPGKGMVRIDPRPGDEVRVGPSMRRVLKREGTKLQIATSLTQYWIQVERWKKWCKEKRGRSGERRILSAVDCLDALASNLQTALAVPFAGKRGTAGVITLYHLDRNAFDQTISAFLSQPAYRSDRPLKPLMKFQNAEESATDHLTGVPNARQLRIQIG
jgi:hypothetical protein